ncbi:hypothetical protein STEG23_025964 [Scotinomys teguina]
MKLRSVCKAKDIITKTKHQPTELEKIFTNPTSDRGLISRIYKELKKHDIKTPNSPIEKWAIELNREFTAEEYRMAERHLRCEQANGITPAAMDPSNAMDPCNAMDPSNATNPSNVFPVTEDCILQTKMKTCGLLPGWYGLTSQDLLTALQMFQNPDQLQDNWLKDEASQTAPVKIEQSS